MQKALRDALMNRPGVGGGRDRDHELIGYIGRQGVVRISDVMTEMGVGRSVAYQRVAVCVEAGLLERLAVLRFEPTLLRATKEGLRYAGLGLPLAEVSPGGVVHSLRCVSTAHALSEHFGAERVLTERELVHAEQSEGRPIASAEIGTLPNGAPRLHRPDLAVLAEVGVISVEVELTAKSPARLKRIMRAWMAARWVSEVHYLCPKGPTLRAVRRAVDAVGASKVGVVGKVPG